MLPAITLPTEPPELTSIQQQDRAFDAETDFLEQQLLALAELRQDGHFSDIVRFARDGSRKARRLSARRSRATSDRHSQLVKQYYDLVKSLLH